VKYFDIYTKMQKRIEELKINEEWGYRLVGWYNFQSRLETLKKRKGEIGGRG
jgi:hypothetical protein